MKTLKLIILLLFSFGSTNGQSEFEKDAIFCDTLVLEMGYSEINTFVDNRKFVSSVYQDEKLLFSRYFYDDLNTWKLFEFNELGYLCAIRSFDGDCMDGIAYTFYSNDILESIGNYKKVNREHEEKIEQISQNNSTGESEFVTTVCDCESVKDGLWNYFDINGLLVKSEFWQNGECILCND